MDQPIIGCMPEMAGAYRGPAGGGWLVWLGRGDKKVSSGDVEADPDLA